MTKKSHGILQPVTATASILLMAAALSAQHVPSARGSLDAVVPSTQPGSPLGAMPAGHPQTPGATQPARDGAAAIPGHPPGMQAPKTGALRVLVSQGTPNAAPIGKDSAKVELLAKGVVIKSYNTVVGDQGVIELRDLPLDPPFQPVITIFHGGSEEQLVGVAMHKYQPAVELEMKVYEPTTEKPAWTIGLRHIIAQPMNAPGGEVVLQVTEMFGVFNPLDRAWTGEEIAGEKQVVALPLPEGAQDVQLGPGLAEAKAKVVNNKIVRGKTMLPGSTQYVFGYTLPVKGGKTALSLIAPAEITLLALYVPDDAKLEKVVGLETASSAGTHSNEKRQLLKAKGVKTGDVVSVELSNLKVPPPATLPAESNQTTDCKLTPKPAGKRP